MHTIASSGYLPLASASVGSCGTAGHGFAYATAAGSYAASGFLYPLLTLRQEFAQYEVGVIYAPGTAGATSLEADMSDWEILGLSAGNFYKLDLKAAGSCVNSPSRTFPESRFQIMVVPDNFGMQADNTCSTSANDCCSQHPSCIAFQCYPNPAIPRNPHAGASVCTVPPLPEPTAFNFYTVTPCRVFDSRNAPNVPLSLNAPMQITVGGLCGVPASAKSVALNLTAVSPSADVAIQIYPGNQPPPPGTNVNSTAAGGVRAAFGVLTLATNGTGTVTVLPSASTSGTTNVVLDVTGYFQ
ncbi:MAG TPA: hypothetical protein VMW75_05075 [Thermoanaerobaculia bacterium]|nr:hypothetical protein [Thermoanaerobaculia bacterium]